MNPDSNPEAPSEALADPALAPVLEMIQQWVIDITRAELNRFRQEMTFQSLMDRARQKYPELEAFESLLLKAMIDVLEADPDTETDSWDTILQKSVTRLQKTMANSLVLTPNQTTASPLVAPQMESASVRQSQAAPKRYTRKAIAKMTLAEFLRNEKDIEAALQDKRID